MTPAIMAIRPVALALAAALAAGTPKSKTNAFTPVTFKHPAPSVQTINTRRKDVSKHFNQWRLNNNAVTNEEESQRLLTMLTRDDNDESSSAVIIANSISNLEASFNNSNSTLNRNDAVERFNPLIDLYRVQYVQSSNSKNKNNNPVGGKWTRSNGIVQKIFRTRKSYQHLLPFNETGMSSSYTINGVDAIAEAINVISLDAFDGRVRAYVLLRGDAVPLTFEELKQWNGNSGSNQTRTTLSNLAVRAYFDPPRIVFGIKRKKNGLYSYLPLQLGPSSDVVLDTTYYDDIIRIGMGGTSGTRFVFVRTNKDDEEAKEYKDLLAMPLANKVKVMSRLGVIMTLSMYIASGGGIGLVNLWKRMSVFGPSLIKPQLINLAVFSRFRILAGISSLVTGLLLLLISFSSGGIERDDNM